MAKRQHPLIVVLLVLAAVILLGSTQVWAQCASPCESVRIYADQATGSALRTLWDPCTCAFIAAYLCPEGQYDSATGSCGQPWGGPFEVQDAYVCTGGTVDTPTNCSQANAGPRASGCIFRTWFTLIGGFGFLPW
jgi:hypothetical protein